MANISNSPRVLKIAVVIGRFQPLHNGHCRILDYCSENFDGIIVLVGSSDKARDIKNPFTFDERSAMICKYQETKKVLLTVSPLHDEPYNNTAWLKEVNDKVMNSFIVIVNTVEITLIGFERDQSSWYLNAFPQWKKQFVTELPSPVGGQILSASNLRTRLFTKKFPSGQCPTTASDTAPFLLSWLDVPSATFSFLSKFVKTQEFKELVAEHKFNIKFREPYAKLKYGVTFSTTDVVLIQSGHVLVIVRGALPGRGQWALPGGYLAHDKTLVQNAIKELLEETGIRLAEGKRAKEMTEVILTGAIRAEKSFDLPDRSIRGRIVTTAFLLRLDDTKPLPLVHGMNAPLEETDGAEVVETISAMWVPVGEALINRKMWFEDHHAIFKTMLGMVRD